MVLAGESVGTPGGDVRRPFMLHPLIRVLGPVAFFHS